MRQGEIFSLRWRDVDLENGLLNIQAFHTKTMKERQVAITTRLAFELERLKASAPDNSDGLVFGIIDIVKRSFTAARSKAGLKDVRFHDLRHCGNVTCGCSHSAIGGWTCPRPYTGEYNLSLRQRKHRDRQASGGSAGRIQRRGNTATGAGRDGKLKRMDERLISSADGDPEVDEAWSAEVARRQAEIESGAVPLLPGPETLAKLKAEFQ